MSQARVYTTKGPVRKDGLRCGKCGDPIRKGIDRRRTFAVGYRGYEQTRCMKPECTPTRSELESSMVGSVYDAVDSVELSAAGSLEDLESIRDEIAGVIDEVVSDYESNEMFEINYDLQERVDTLQSASDELQNWSPEEDEPDEDDRNTWGEHDTFEDAYDAWLDEARESLRSAIDEMELP
jgi:hypothetical protein